MIELFDEDDVTLWDGDQVLFTVRHILLRLTASRAGSLVLSSTQEAGGTI